MQFDTYIPLRISGVLVAEEIGVSVFVETDINGEPYVEELWIDNLDKKAPLKLCGSECNHEKRALWLNLSPIAWEAVKGDVADAMLEAAA